MNIATAESRSNVITLRRCFVSEDTKKPKDVSRRDFLKSTGGAAAIAGLALGGVATHAKDVAAASDPTPKKWDEAYDVVIIGSGFAGLAAAIEARNAGAVLP
ncbi:MAG: hypothetical protein A4E63_00241 [Syntrophorhabdus sp. PtaU1.Bin050]|nr:MAG: hypothetical protein A4E63_00241 [Syntrophorhabdus sp. PtaU1.Bin050]